MHGFGLCIVFCTASGKDCACVMYQLLLFWVHGAHLMLQEVKQLVPYNSKLSTALVDLFRFVHHSGDKTDFTYRHDMVYSMNACLVFQFRTCSMLSANFTIQHRDVWIKPVSDSPLEQPVPSAEVTFLPRKDQRAFLAEKGPDLIRPSVGRWKDFVRFIIAENHHVCLCNEFFVASYLAAMAAFGAGFFFKVLEPAPWHVRNI